MHLGFAGKCYLFNDFCCPKLSMCKFRSVRAQNYFIYYKRWKRQSFNTCLRTEGDPVEFLEGTTAAGFQSTPSYRRRQPGTQLYKNQHIQAAFPRTIPEHTFILYPNVVKVYSNLLKQTIAKVLGKACVLRVRGKVVIICKYSNCL